MTVITKVAIDLIYGKLYLYLAMNTLMSNEINTCFSYSSPTKPGLLFQENNFIFRQFPVSVFQEAVDRCKHSFSLSGFNTFVAA